VGAPDTAKLGELILRCRPGTNFIGLWVVKVKTGTSYRTWWCVSYIDHDNVHVETPLFWDPLAALSRCVRELGL
jgi:hypothetical protein